MRFDAPTSLLAGVFADYDRKFGERYSRAA